MQIAFGHSRNFMSSKPPHDRIIDPRFEQPTQRRVSEIMVVQIMKAVRHGKRVTRDEAFL